MPPLRDQSYAWGRDASWNRTGHPSGKLLKMHPAHPDDFALSACRRVMLNNRGEMPRDRGKSIAGPRRAFGGGLKRAFWWTLLWEPRDLWLGIYWDRPEATGWPRALDVYVCVLPCLPVKLVFRRMLPSSDVMGSR